MLEIIFALFTLAALLGAFSPSKRWGHRISCMLSLFASLLLLDVSIQALEGSPITLKLLQGIIVLPLEMDMLSAFFSMVFGIVFTIVSLYSLKYIEEGYTDRGSGLRIHALCLPIFMASMVAVILVRSGFWLIFAWELMSLSSFILVVYEHKRQDVRNAGLIYFAMSHAAAALLIVVVLTLASHTSPLSFLYSSLSSAYKSLDPHVAMCLAILFTIAMGIKSGVVPLHFWLPRAHPAAPSNISALLSGIMVKTSIFLLLYFTTKIFYPAIEIGALILVLGILSILIGCLYAVPQNDCKVLLAYSTIGHIGYIWLALGAGLMIYAYSGQFALYASLLISAGLFHLMNHAFFKSLLFMVTGNVILKTETRDMDILGGLGKAMPFTSFIAMIGILSLIGLPIFNGFASKWMIYVTGISSPAMDHLTMLIHLGVALALFGGTLTAIYSIKFYSEIFTGQSRVKVAKGDVSPIITVPEAVLAIACIVFGIFPGAALSVIFKPVSTLIPEISVYTLAEGVKFYLSLLVIPSTMPLTSVCFTLLAVFIPIAFGILYALAHPLKTRVEAPWLGGYKFDIHEIKFPASSLYAGFEKLVSPLYRVKFPTVKVRYPEPNADKVLVSPWVKLGAFLGEVKRIQVGRVQVYVGVLFILLIIVLVARVLG
ncbi:hypothetical protein DRO02_04210 [archaeon]|nr:MAG: hypothetical protein DRO02_04210 [archaeon]